MYQLIKDSTSIKRLSDGACIPESEGNRDWQEYQLWLAEGNTPEPVDQPTIEEQRAELKSVRDTSLNALTHDFGDGRVIQVRPQDASNLQLGVATGQNEWVMEDDVPHPVTTAELQTAFDSGIAQGIVIWNEYMTALKLL